MLVPIYWRRIPIGLLLLAILVLSACGKPAPAVTTSGPTPQSTQSVQNSQNPQGLLVPVLAVSELSVGMNRISVGLVKDGTPINDANLRLGLRFFYLDGDQDTVVQSESPAVYRGQGLPFGLYIGYADFDKPGNWSVEISIPRSDGQTQVSNMRLNVLEKTSTPNVGDPVIQSKNLTVRDNPDLSKISSDPKPDPDFYQLTIADAVAAKKPFVIAFSTPGYCQTAVCAPNMLVMKKLKEQYKDQINFIHIEVYPYPYGESFKKQVRVPPMDEWRLITEPWTYLVDAQGIIQARYEGGITFDEMDPALKQLAAGQPITPLIESAAK